MDIHTFCVHLCAVCCVLRCCGLTQDSGEKVTKKKRRQKSQYGMSAYRTIWYDTIPLSRYHRVIVKTDRQILSAKVALVAWRGTSRSSRQPRLHKDWDHPQDPLMDAAATIRVFHPFPAARQGGQVLQAQIISTPRPLLMKWTNEAIALRHKLMAMIRRLRCRLNLKDCFKNSTIGGLFGRR